MRPRERRKLESAGEQRTQIFHHQKDPAASTRRKEMLFDEWQADMFHRGYYVAMSSYKCGDTKTTRKPNHHGTVGQYWEYEKCKDINFTPSGQSVLNVTT